jgi:hypothetical protein
VNIGITRHAGTFLCHAAKYNHVNASTVVLNVAFLSLIYINRSGSRHSHESLHDQGFDRLEFYKMETILWIH